MPEDDKNRKPGPDTGKNEPLENRGRIEEALGERHPLLSREKIQSILALDFMPSLVQLIASMPEAPEVDPELLVARIRALALSPEQTDHLKTRLELSKMLCGQSGRDLRRELDCFARSRDKAMPGMIAPELLEAQQSLEGFLINLTAGSASPHEILQPPLSEELRKLVSKPESLYERIVTEANMVNYRAGNEADLPEIWRGRFAAVLELPEDTFQYEPMNLIARRKHNLVKDEYVANLVVKKWIDLVLLTFRGQQRGADFALDTLGFIPEELYTKKIFREKVGFEDLAGLHTTLRNEHENQRNTTAMGGHNKRRLLHVRAQLIRHLFTSGIAETVKQPDEDQITLDANGLFINLSAGRQHKKAAHIGLHSHLPYSQVTDELLTYLLEHQWISEGDVEEIRLQKAKVNHDVTTENAIEIQKAERYYEALMEEYKKGPEPGDALDRREAEELKTALMQRKNCPSEAHAGIAAYIFHERRKYRALWDVLLSNPNLHVPEGAFRYFFETNTRSTPYLRERFGSSGTEFPTKELLMIASNLQQGIASPNTQKEGDESPDSIRDLENRSKILHDKRHYDVARIIGVLLDGGLPPSYPWGEYAMFRGRLENRGQDEVHFLESPVGSQHYELLLIPRKHLNARQRREFLKVMELKRSEYEAWMTESEEYFEVLRAMNTTYQAMAEPTVDEARQKLMEPAKAFLQYLREKTLQPVDTYETLLSQLESEQDLKKFREILHKFELLWFDRWVAHGRQRIYNPELFRKD